jgi:hypothetical protein
VLQSRRFAADSGESIVLYEVAAVEQISALVYRLYKS